MVIRMDKIMNKIAEFIKENRKAAGLTQEELGQLCNTTKQTIYKYEIGKVTNIPLDRIETISKAIGVTPAYLMGWEESPSGSDEKTADPKAGGGESLEDIIPGYDALSNENKDRVRDYVAVRLAAQQNQ